MLPCIFIFSFNLIIWEFRCNSPVFGVMIAFVFLLIAFLLWDRERIIRSAWAASERRDIAVIESQRNAAHDIRNDLQEVVGLVSTLDQAYLSQNNSGGDADDYSYGKGNDGNGGLSVHYTDQDPRELQNQATRSTSEGAADNWKTQSELRELKKRFAHHPLSPFTQMNNNKTTTASGTEIRRGDVVRRSSSTISQLQQSQQQSQQSHETKHYAEDMERNSDTLRQRHSSSSLKSNDDSPLDLDVKSRVRRAATRIKTRLESGLRDTHTAIQRKLLVPTIEPCDLASVIYYDVAYDPLITYEKDDDFPSIVETDSAWFRNCLANLIGNAKKHGPKHSKINVRLLWLAQSSTIKVEVKDEGKGVSSHQALTIFRDDRPLGAHIGENGIGLQAVRTYISGLGGSVGADGSTFWLKLPVVEEPVNMHPLFLTFTGNAELKFCEYFQPSLPVITLSVSM